MFEWHDLNARHEASIFWTIVILIFCFISSKDIRHSASHLVVTFLSPLVFFSILWLLFNVVAISMIIVILGRMIGFWETLPVVGTIMWALTSGLALLMNFEAFMKNHSEFRSQTAGLLAPVAIISETLGNAIFPLYIELIVIPFIVIFTYGVYSQTNQSTKKFFQWLLLAYGLVLLTTFICNLIDNSSSWKSMVQSLIFPLLMTIGVFPCLKSLILFERCRFLLGVKSTHITANEYGKDWPLIVAHAKLCCKNKAVWIETERKRYPLNAWAKTLLKQRGLSIEELKSIWRDDPKYAEIASGQGTNAEIFVLKVSIGRLIEDGLALENIETSQCNDLD